MTDFFASDDWQPADWLQALDRLAPAPAVEVSSMKPKKPCANCGIVPEVNQAFGRDWWIECKNPHCKNQVHQMTYYPTPEQAVTAWDAPRWYESQPADEIPASSKMLDAMPNVPILEWHACASGQPSTFGWYAVTDARGNVYAARWTDNPYASSERARKPRWVSAHGRIDTNVAYWHPMPPAPAIEVQA